MRRIRLRTWLLSVASLGALALALGNTSCSQQAEGERCDLNNGISGGDSDCNDNLVCTKASDLGTETDRCCPADRNQSTVPPCLKATSVVEAGAAPPDAGTTTDGSTATDTGSTVDAADAADATGITDSATEGG